MLPRLVYSTFCATLLSFCSFAEPPALPANYQLLYEQNFKAPTSLEGFVMSDPDAWKLASDEDGFALELAAQSQYKPAVRSPVNIALIKDVQFGDFVLEADMLQTGREYGHRDMCLFFGFQKPAQFYYTHIATAADPNAHNIFIVNDKPRTNIASKTTSGVKWGSNVWHKVRLERTLKDGLIKVYFDDLAEPIMVAQDTTFKDGYIGFGSFDDTGKIDNIRIWGPKKEAKEQPADFFNAKKKSTE